VSETDLVEVLRLHILFLSEHISLQNFHKRSSSLLTARMFNKNNNDNGAHASANAPEEGNKSNKFYQHEWSAREQFYLEKIAELEVRLNKLEKRKDMDANKSGANAHPGQDIYPELESWTKTENLTDRQYRPSDDADDTNHSDDQTQYETGDTCDTSGWSLTNSDLRNCQDYVDSLEGFDEMLEREAKNGHQSLVYNVRREASPNQNRRGIVQLQKNQDQPHQQGRF
jgi:hypothetical protein